MLPAVDLSAPISTYGWLGYNDFQLMQFTGLYDKVGKKIFEGDILCEYGIGEGDAFLVKDITPLQRNFGYSSPREDDWMSWPEMYVVIGNVYENPELLVKLLK